MRRFWGVNSTVKSPTSYTNTPFEIFIIVFTLLPFLVLAYFYAALPERVPLLLNLKGEVSTWTEKSVLSVFRVPLMAVVFQVVCLLMKYGTLQYSTVARLEMDVGQTKLNEQYLSLNTGLWDWFRWAIAIKMIAESVDTIFLSLERFKFLSQPAFIISAVAAALGVIGGLYYGYRLLAVRRELKREFGNGKAEEPVDAQHVYGGFLYFNKSDPALFVSRYLLNFGNKWAWVFIACFIAYPLLVIFPA